MIYIFLLFLIVELFGLFEPLRFSKINYKYKNNMNLIKNIKKKFFSILELIINYKEIKNNIKYIDAYSNIKDKKNDVIDSTLSITEKKD